MSNILNFIKQISVKFYIKIKQICKVLETKIKVLLNKISVSSKKAHQNISASIKKIHNKFNDSKTKAQLVNIREKINTKLQHKHSKKIIVSSLLLFSASVLVIISVFSTRAAFIQNNKSIYDKANNSKYNIIIETPRLISIENGKKHQFVASYKNYEYDPKNLLEVRIELINSKNEIFYSDPGIFNPKDKTIVFALDKLPKDTIYTFRSIKILEQKKISDSSHKDIMFNTKSLIFNQSKSSAKLYDNNYVLMNLAIENNLNIPTQKLLNEVLKEDYLPEQKEKIIDLLLDLVNKNYKSVLESNKINLGDKELVIKLSNSEDKKFLEKDVYYFILNSKTIQQQNQTNDPEAILLSNKDKSIQFTITKDPFISANKLGKAIQNNKFDIKRLSSETLFGHNEDGANTYRIPGIIKLKNGTLIANADKRYDSLDDLGQNITQAIKFSYDNGRTWTKPKEILKVQIPSLNNQGLVIDGVMQEIEYLDTNTNTKKTKLLFLVDLFPAKFGIRNLKGGNPWVTIDNKNYLKLWTRNNSKLEGNSLLERVAGTQNWYRRVTLKNGKKFNNVTSSDLVPTNDYVDLNYHTETNTITGIVYNNIQSESELIKPQLLESKKSNYSVLDNGENSKYLIGVNDYIVSIESYDDGQTWTGLNWIYDDSFSKLYKDSNFIGTAVGNPIQLKHQKDPKLNGRIIVPAYGFMVQHHFIFIAMILEENEMYDMMLQKNRKSNRIIYDWGKWWDYLLT
ncbi:sialidase family protein [Mycoplasmopsis cynos]|uniref:sialidase family protein n=1 Tax=Mycoplasmopsis cynos TaxID=171284 RepID=UPI002541EB16|nr:sialidase family protein [Mycoplasmopsis cynos]MCU9935582.1 glycoside hydrolase [Mycoplasmopsis cynos]